MRKFLIKIGMTLCLVLAVHLLIALLFANGKIDSFYLRFTTPRQHSLVLGNSRAAQGIVPLVLDSALTGLGIEGPTFNYSFTLNTSPYGPYYLESIKKKLQQSTKNGLFILAVDPWSISRDVNLNDTDTAKFFDAQTMPFSMHYVNVNPNPEFLLKYYDYAWGKMIITNAVKKTPVELHLDGWLEVTVPMDSEQYQERIAAKIDRYKTENVNSLTLSPLRVEYLAKTIRYLQQFGTVFLVRVPIDPRLADIENDYMPQFEDLIRLCATENNVEYLDYFPDNQLYQTTDGNHLYKKSSKLFSLRLAQDVRNHLEQKKQDFVIR